MIMEGQKLGDRDNLIPPSIFRGLEFAAWFSSLWTLGWITCGVFDYGYGRIIGKSQR